MNGLSPPQQVQGVWSRSYSTLCFALCCCLCGLVTSCFDQLNPEPTCFEAPAELDDEVLRSTLEERFKYGSSYCSDETRSCLTVWSGVEELDDLSNRELLDYPFLYTLEATPISPFFSQCTPRCEAPLCQCLMRDDCGVNEYCVSGYFLGAVPTLRTQQTMCLPRCEPPQDAQSPCPLQSASYVCIGNEDEPSTPCLQPAGSM